MHKLISFSKKHAGTMALVTFYLLTFGVMAYAQLPDNGVFSDGAGGANFQNGITSVFKLLKWACGVGGVISVIIMGFNIMNNQPWVKPLIAAFVLFGISGIVHFVFNMANGKEASLGF